MKKDNSIDVEVTREVEPTKNQALAVREPTSSEIDRPMQMDELQSNLSFIRQVMETVMKEGQDYGKVPGCGDKPGLFQPGAQKLCMTFQLTDEVKEERVTDLPNYHREYSFVVRLVSKSGRHWEGVGTCSTLEGKYRFRKAERRCPKCGKSTIIVGKPEYGGGFVCFAKKGGCNAKFSADDPAITRQAAGQVEHENPADYWNTVRKMAFKRALVHAAINATNTSELWSQDLEDLPPQGGQAPKTPSDASEPPKGQSPTQEKKASPAPKSAKKPTEILPTEQSRTKMIAALSASESGDERYMVTEYFEQLNQLLPGEELEQLPLRFVPATQSQMSALAEKIAKYAQGDPAERAFSPHDLKVDAPGKTKKNSDPKPYPATGQVETPSDDWFWKVIVPIPRKGQKRDVYMQAPDTILSLYEARHGDDEESHVCRTRLFGFLNNFEPKGWEKTNGEKMPPSESDKLFRRALDSFGEWFEKNHPDEKL